LGSEGAVEVVESEVDCLSRGENRSVKGRRLVVQSRNLAQQEGRFSNYSKENYH
jgi:hypothetical protein